MSTTAQRPTQRRDARYTICGSTPVSVQLRLHTEESGDAIGGHLLDLSRGGAKVCVPVGLPIAESVRLTLDGAEWSVGLDLSAEVCWSRPAENDHWLIGCSITPKISDDLLTKLASCAFIERRQSARRRLDVNASASWELGDKPFPVQLRDYSTEGFSLVVHQPGGVGQRVLVRVTKPDGTEVSISGTAKWQLKLEGDYIVGCCLNNSRDFQILRELAASIPEPAVTPAKPASRSSAKLLIAAVLIAGVTFGAGFGLRGLLDRSGQDPFADPPPTARGDDTASQMPDTRPHVPPQESASDQMPIGEPTTVVEPVIIPEGAAAHPVEKRVDVTEPSPATSVPSVPPTGVAVLDAIASTARNTLSQARNAPSTAGQAPAEATDRAAQTTPITREPQDVTTLIRSEPEKMAHSPSPMRATSRSPAPHVTTPAPAASEEAPGMAHVATEHLDGGGHEVGEPPSAETAGPDASTVPSSDSSALAAAAFSRGGRLLRAGKQQEALHAFLEATQNDRRNPLYHYLLAMTQHQMHQVEQARRSAARAVELERDRPIKNWGRNLVRYQGRSRLWLEQFRSRALRE